jgi:hypothetical protein
VSLEQRVESTDEALDLAMQRINALQNGLEILKDEVLVAARIEQLEQRLERLEHRVLEIGGSLS